MDSERTVHGITWTDDLAWMESMKGERWNSFIKAEQERWNNLSKSKLPKLKSQIYKASAIANQMRFTAGNVFIGQTGTMSYTWKWRTQSDQKTMEAADICVKGDCVYVSYEDTAIPGAENYVISAFRIGSTTPIWTVPGMSPFVGILGYRCYSIEAKNKLVYYKCVSWNCVTGGDRRVEYEEKDSRYNLELIRGNNCLFLRRQSGPKQDVICLLTNRLLKPVSLESSRFVFGCVGEDEYLHWSSTGKWTAADGLKRYMLPSFVNETPEYIDTRRNLLITRMFGKRTLWHISDGVPRIMWKGVGNLMVDPWEGNWLRLVVPGVPVAWHDLSKMRLIPNKGIVQERFARSADGTDVPFYIVSHGRPKALFISAYSAYGISTGFSTARWVPLLSEGFAVCFGVYRGGGDHTPEWEDDGRLSGRIKVLEDAEAVVREARRICDVPASKTIIYGRSAGGLWVGGLCSKYPKGDLFGGAYMEVPFLDVLRTTTNNRLPLTLLETDEFGLPSLRLSDFIGMLQWSPMETLPSGGADLFQILRTGLNDPQVFAYESAKWVERNREKGRVYLAIEGDQGHFVNGSTGLHQKAEDLSLIIDFIKNRSN
jgi:hypothetical protein